MKLRPPRRSDIVRELRRRKWLPAIYFLFSRAGCDDAVQQVMPQLVGIEIDGDELVIDTTHIAASTITNNGLDHSEAIHMVERYKLSPDGTKLLATQWFEDPEVLENNGARFIEWVKHEGQFILPYECDPSFGLNYTATKNTND